MTPATQERLEQAILFALPEYPKAFSTKEVRTALADQGGWKIG